MRAWVLTRYGGPEAAEFRDVPVPKPGPRDVQIRVQAAGLNPVDYKLREGQLKVIHRPELPLVMGCDLAGVVEAIGSDVTRFRVGDRVFARVAKSAYGAFAEVACVNEALVARMPETLDFPEAAGVPLAALTAMQCLRDELHAGKGMRLLITGGAGGVGTFAIQLAKWLGAEVVTTASPRGEELVRRLGADEVVDYTRRDALESLKDMDGALDLVGGDSLDLCFGAVKRGGTVVSIAGMPEPETARKDLQAGRGLEALFWLASLKFRRQARAHGLRYRYKFMHPSGEELAELAALIDQGELDVVIDKVFPFGEIDQAFRYLEQGRAKGKVVVDLREA
ncbi:Zinc-type alcohol dehydrogenase-like protein [compost metagenome]